MKQLKHEAELVKAAMLKGVGQFRANVEFLQAL